MSNVILCLKKNKSVRGSVEDDVNEAKRPVTTSENMADNDNQENSDVEPTLSDLRGMLDILSDNQKIKEQMSALKLSVDTQGREFQKMKEGPEGGFGSHFPVLFYEKSHSHLGFFQNSHSHFKRSI